MASLFDSLDIGDLRLQNRVFMAPLTRNRAQRTAFRDLWLPPTISSAALPVLSSPKPLKFRRQAKATSIRQESIFLRIGDRDKARSARQAALCSWFATDRFARSVPVAHPGHTRVGRAARRTASRSTQQQQSTARMDFCFYPFHAQISKIYALSPTSISKSL